MTRSSETSTVPELPDELSYDDIKNILRLSSTEIAARIYLGELRYIREDDNPHEISDVVEYDSPIVAEEINRLTGSKEKIDKKKLRRIILRAPHSSYGADAVAMLKQKLSLEKINSTDYCRLENVLSMWGVQEEEALEKLDEIGECLEILVELEGGEIDSEDPFLIGVKLNVDNGKKPVVVCNWSKFRQMLDEKKRDQVNCSGDEDLESLICDEEIMDRIKDRVLFKNADIWGHAKPRVKIETITKEVEKRVEVERRVEVEVIRKIPGKVRKSVLLLILATGVSLGVLAKSIFEPSQNSETNQVDSQSAEDIKEKEDKLKKLAQEITDRPLKETIEAFEEFRRLQRELRSRQEKTQQ